MKLLEKHHKEQRDWYAKMIRMLPAKYRQKAEKGYEQVYKEAYHAEPVEHKKKNAAVRAANIRLREFVRRVNG